MSIYQNQYEQWLLNATLDPDIRSELETITDNDAEIDDRFYKSLEFGTGGLRGVIGAGTNRMNVYTVAQATQGLADFLNSEFQNPSVAIAHDSRIKSDLFAKTAACVLAANGIHVWFYKVLVPTPMLSFAVIRLKCSSGIIVTASHNPSKYNGYKCYDYRGYQMTDESAAKTLAFIEKVDIFNDIRLTDFDKAISDGIIEYIPDSIFEEFYSDVMKCQIMPGICSKADLKVIYTPLNGTGNIPVRTVLSRIGVKDLQIVSTQEQPDGTFPTCPYPNPEIKQVFEEGLKMTADFPADIMLATDPDCDRVGIAVRHNGDYKLMTGNEVGCLLTDFILSQKKAAGILPENPVIVKTIVTTELARRIAEDYNAEVFDFLTGFKYIGEKLEELAAAGQSERYQIGFEESYGYLTGAHARDKDAVNGSLSIIEMAAYYKTLGKTLIDVMNSIYERYGYYLNSLLNFAFEGADGMKKMSEMMESIRNNAPTSIGGKKVVVLQDYKTGSEKDLVNLSEREITLPKSNVLSYTLEGGTKVIVRPSGTEPKIKIYIMAVTGSESESADLTSMIETDMKALLGL